MNLTIIAGKLKGKVIKVPEEARPVTSRVKSVIFDSLGTLVENAHVLDLFSGSGNLGFESLSRGASFITLVDHNPYSIKIIEENTKHLQVEETTNVIKDNYKRFVKHCEDKFDLIFMDPPFHFIDEVNFKILSKILKPDGILILKLEKGSRLKLGDELKIIMTKSLGINIVHFVRLA
jgi:16S rRNA (guanine966-N2)-methyltransferase